MDEGFKVPPPVGAPKRPIKRALSPQPQPSTSSAPVQQMPLKAETKPETPMCKGYPRPVYNPFRTPSYTANSVADAQPKLVMNVPAQTKKKKKISPFYDHVDESFGLSEIGQLRGLRMGRRRGRWRRHLQSTLPTDRAEVMKIVEPLIKREIEKEATKQMLITSGLEHFAKTVNMIVDDFEGNNDAIYERILGKDFKSKLPKYSINVRAKMVEVAIAAGINEAIEADKLKTDDKDDKIDDKMDDKVDDKMDDKINKMDNKVDDKMDVKVNDKMDDKINKMDNKVDDKMDVKVDDKLDDKVDDKMDDKVDGKIDIKVDDKMDVKVDDKLDDKVDDKMDDKVDDKMDIKVDDKMDVKVSDKFDDKVYNKMDIKVDDKMDIKVHNKLDDKVDDEMDVKVDDKIDVKVDDKMDVKAKAIKVDNKVDDKIEDEAENDDDIERLLGNLSTKGKTAELGRLRAELITAQILTGITLPLQQYKFGPEACRMAGITKTKKEKVEYKGDTQYERFVGNFKVGISEEEEKRRATLIKEAVLAGRPLPRFERPGPKKGRRMSAEEYLNIDYDSDSDYESLLKNFLKNEDGFHAKMIRDVVHTGRPLPAFDLLGLKKGRKSDDGSEYKLFLDTFSMEGSGDEGRLRAESIREEILSGVPKPKPTFDLSEPKKFRHTKLDFRNIVPKKVEVPMIEAPKIEVPKFDEKVKDKTEIDYDDFQTTFKLEETEEEARLRAEMMKEPLIFGRPLPELDLFVPQKSGGTIEKIKTEDEDEDEPKESLRKTLTTVGSDGDKLRAKIIKKALNSEQPPRFDVPVPKKISRMSKDADDEDKAKESLLKNLMTLGPEDDELCEKIIKEALHSDQPLPRLALSVPKKVVRISEDTKTDDKDKAETDTFPDDIIQSTFKVLEDDEEEQPGAKVIRKPWFDTNIEERDENKTDDDYKRELAELKRGMREHRKMLCAERTRSAGPDDNATPEHKPAKPKKSCLKQEKPEAEQARRRAEYRREAADCPDLTEEERNIRVIEEIYAAIWALETGDESVENPPSKLITILKAFDMV